MDPEAKPTTPRLPYAYGQVVYLKSGPVEHVGTVTGYRLGPGICQVVVRWGRTLAEDVHFPFELVTQPGLCPSPEPWAN